MEILFPPGLLSAVDRDIRMQGLPGLDFFRSLEYPCPDFTQSEWQAFSIAKSLTKKFLPGETSMQDSACLTKFLSCNKHCGEWSLVCNTSLDEELFGTAKSILDDFFNPRGYPLASWDDIFLQGRCGPGASVGSDGNDFYTKMFSSSLSSCSRFLVDHYEHNVSRWPSWNYAENFRANQLGRSTLVDGSKLSFVPKNDRISRSICTEPVLNMFYQLGYGRIIERRLGSRFGIDLSTQPDINRALAASGSEGGSWCTIDLESASDTISLALCDHLLPKDVVALLKIMRSPVTTCKGSKLPLHMVSTMGNGFTFPLQTAIFAAVVEAAYTSVGLPLLKGAYVNFGVFGDDLVIDKRAKERVLRLLGLLGFKVNAAKSFFEGPFRESCGHDYVNGQNIRGVYPRRLREPQDFYALINALNSFTARTGFLLPAACRWLLAKVDRSMEIPAWEDPSSGICTPLALVRSRRVRKYAKFQSYTYDRLEPRKRMIRIGADYVCADRRGRRRIYNSYGLLVSLVQGMALSSGLPCRLATDRWPWRRKRLSCSSWDRLQLDSTLNGGFDWRRFETAVYSNFIWVEPMST